MRSDAPGLLHGVPYTAKDLVDTAGVRTTYGSLLFRDNVPSEDAVAVARLRRQGAILVGKTTTPEFGTKGLTDAPLFGRTRNAWSARHSCGGSSGGAAVAVASGLAPLAVATDGGGSTRIPAACNGVVGLKQSNGVIPHSQVPDAFGNYTYVTPMTRTVMDTALMLQAMAGPDETDPWSIGLPIPDYLAAARPEGDLGGVRIPLLPHAAPASPSRLREGCVRRGPAAPGRVGRGSRRASRRGLRDRAALAGDQSYSTWRSRFAELVARSGDRMSPSLVRQVNSAAHITGTEYQQAMFARADALPARSVPLSSRRSPRHSRPCCARRCRSSRICSIPSRSTTSRCRICARLVPLDDALQSDGASGDQRQLRLLAGRAADRAAARRPFPRRDVAVAGRGSLRGCVGLAGTLAAGPLETWSGGRSPCPPSLSKSTRSSPAPASLNPTCSTACARSAPTSPRAVRLGDQRGRFQRSVAATTRRTKQTPTLRTLASVGGKRSFVPTTIRAATAIAAVA